MQKRYNDLNTYFRNRFGCRVQKLSVDAGFTCPNRDGTLSRGGCIYCNAKGSGTGAHSRGMSLSEQIERGRKALFRRYKAKKFIVYFQSFSNTYAPVERLERLYQEALSEEGVVGLSIGTRPDCVDAQVLDLIESFARKHLIWIEYGLQSSNDQTLDLINRGHNARCFEKAVEATRSRGINICAHVILGLPGETRTHMLNTAEFITRAGIDGLKLHLLYVVKGTKLEAMFRQGACRCLDQRAYVDLVCDFLERIPAEMIIQRLTGDPHPDELVAPQWSLEKADTRKLIMETLEKRDTWQGKKTGSPAFP